MLDTGFLAFKQQFPPKGSEKRFQVSFYFLIMLSSSCNIMTRLKESLLEETEWLVGDIVISGLPRQKRGASWNEKVSRRND